MKPTHIALAAILGTLLATSAHAAVQTVNTTGYSFSYDTDVWDGLVTQVGNTFTFSSLDIQGIALGGNTSIGTASFEGSALAAVTITAAAGYQIAQIFTNSVGSSTFNVGNKTNSYASVVGYVGSEWNTNKGVASPGSSGALNGLYEVAGSSTAGAFNSTSSVIGGFASGTTSAVGNLYAWANLAAFGKNSKAQLQIDSISYSVNVTPVPEPETYSMLLAGIGLVGAAARRRKGKQA